MPRVLLIAYHFPPTGGAGVQRAVKFAKYLPGFGYDLTVLTGPGHSTGRWTPLDPSLCNEIGVETTIIRAHGSIPPDPGRWRARLERWGRRRSAFAAWWVDSALDAAKGIGADAIVATMSPFESATVAAALSRRLGVPWIADLRDPWALDEMTVYPTGLHRALERRRMNEALLSAAAIVMNTKEAARQLRATYPALAKRRITAIPNGFDAMDFAAPVPPRSDTAFRIVHSGYLHTDLGLSHRRRHPVRRLLGGDLAAVDILTRSHVFLLRALYELAASHPELELHLAGAATPEDMTEAQEPFVHFHGYLPHADSIQLIRSADLLFLPMHDVAPGKRATIVPGKTYEYLASGRPILAAVPDGDARDLLLESGHTYVCRPDDVDSMRAAVEHEMARSSIGGANQEPLPEAVARYERKRLAGELAGLLDDVLCSP